MLRARPRRRRAYERDVDFLPFRVAGRDFALDASRVRAIVPFEGQRRGVSVIDLRKKFGLPQAIYGRRQFLIVTETRRGDVGFIADYVSDLIQASRQECRGGKLRAGGRPKRILDPDSLLAA